MFHINEDLSIHITRGDAATITFRANVNNESDAGNIDDITEYGDTENLYQFRSGDVVRFKVFEKKGCGNVLLSKDFEADEETTAIDIELNGSDTKFGEEISKPKDYWYEIELNPETNPNTIIGYDEDGPKIFRLYPEGGEVR